MATQRRLKSGTAYLVLACSVIVLSYFGEVRVVFFPTGGSISAPCQPFRSARERQAGSRLGQASVERTTIDNEQGMSSAQAASNLAKNIVSTGMLSLPAGLAAFATSPGSLWIATLAVLMPLGVFSAYTFWLLGWICDETRATSFGEAWGSVFGKGSGRLVSAVVAISCFLGCVGYSMILGDGVLALVGQMFPAVVTSRSTIITLLNIFVLCPLGLLENLAPLGKFSLIGTFASGYVVLFMALRFFQGSYAPGGRFCASAASSQPCVSNSLGVLLLASIASCAFLAHFSAPRMYSELRSSPGGRRAKLRRFGGVVVGGFSFAMVVYAAVMLLGFLTFGSTVGGNVLDSYAISDPLAGVARAAVVFSVIFGYPFQLVGCADNVNALFGNVHLAWLKPLIMVASTATALFMYDLGRFQAFEGAVVGALLGYVAPSLMAGFRSRGLARARHFGLAILGMIVGFAGVVVILRDVQ